MSQPSLDVSTETEDAAPPGDCDYAETAMADLFRFLGKTHALSILAAMIHHDPRPWRFSELETQLGISSSTLSERLDELIEAGLITRQVYKEIPPRVEYEATPKAEELEPVFHHLGGWVNEHDFELG